MKNDQEEARKEFLEEWEGKPYRPKFNCPVCKGLGFVHPRKMDRTPDAGRTIPCTEPGCMRDSVMAFRRGDIIRTSGVMALEQTFETFDKDVPGVKKAYEMAEKIAEGMGRFIWLIIYGGVGNGKTHLLNAIANRAMSRGMSTRLVMMAELLSELRMGMDDNKADAILKIMKEVPYLLIDELGLEYGSDWEKEKIEELLAARWNHGRFTVVATNRDISELPERIKSRFLDRHLSRAVLNEAGDYRQTRRRR